MATTREYADAVCMRLVPFGDVRSRKMFGEYVIYVNEKPIFTVCDNTVFVKKIPEVSSLFENCESGFPYDGAKEHFVLDIENKELSSKVLSTLEKVIPVPKKKK